MGGHGGLNILPQKRWNVYNFDNREKVKRDEEAAAKEEQIQREQAAKRDTELRLEKLRQARGFAQASTSKSVPEPEPEPEPELKPEPALKPEREALWDQPREADSRHINLLEGIRFFDPVEIKEKKIEEKRNGGNKRARKEEPVRVVTAEDEKYKLGYGVAGKDVKLPWYMAKPEKKKRADDDEEEEDYDCEVEFGKRKKNQQQMRKKSVQELREERLEREKKERERERALIGEKKSRRSSGFSSGYMPSGYVPSRR